MRLLQGRHAPLRVASRRVALGGTDPFVAQVLQLGAAQQPLPQERRAGAQEARALQEPRPARYPDESVAVPIAQEERCDGRGDPTTMSARTPRSVNRAAHVLTDHGDITKPSLPGSLLAVMASSDLVSRLSRQRGTPSYSS